MIVNIIGSFSAVAHAENIKLQKLGGLFNLPLKGGPQKAASLIYSVYLAPKLRFGGERGHCRVGLARSEAAKLEKAIGGLAGRRKSLPKWCLQQETARDRHFARDLRRAFRRCEPSAGISD
jgi:hypothetical protein